MFFFQYIGKWYEAERYFAFFEFGGKCVTATYSLNDNGTVSVVNRQISSLYVHLINITRLLFRTPF